MNNLSEAMKGNQNGVKLKDPELRQIAYTKYCEWLAKGKSKKSFTFVEGEFMCHWQTIESYLKNAPAEFDPLKKEVAFAQGYAYWESVTDDTAIGKNKDASVPALNMTMRNKYGWDTAEASTAQEESRSDLKDYSKAMKVGRPEPLQALAANHSESPEC